MFKIDKEAKRDGAYDFDVSQSPFEKITFQIGGELGGATVTLFSIINGVRVHVADGGPFNQADDKDQYGKPIQRIVFDGRADTLQVVIKGAVNPNIKMGVR